MRWAQAGNPVGWSGGKGSSVFSASQTAWPQQGGTQQGDSWKSQEAIHMRLLLVDSSGTRASGFGSSVTVGVSDHPPEGATTVFPIAKPEPLQGPCWRKRALG